MSVEKKKINISAFIAYTTTMATGRQRSLSQAEYFLKKSILEYKENKEGFLLKIRICTDRKPFLKNKNVANSIMGSFTPTRVRLVKVLQDRSSGFSALCEKTRMLNHLQMSRQMSFSPIDSEVLTGRERICLPSGVQQIVLNSLFIPSHA